LIFVVGFATSLIGILEYFFVPIEWHVRLGVPIYFRDFLNTYVLKWLYDLPSNYWAEATPTSVIRRAVSVYINGQSFALPFLVVAPVSAYFFFNKPNLLRGIALATVFLGLALNLTRMTMLVCIVQTFLLLAYMRKWKIIGGVIAGLAIGLLIGVMISPRINSFVRRTISGEETSVSTRSQQWVEGIVDLLANPLGHGLGYAGQVGFRTGPAGTEGQGQEAGYFKLTGDMGVVGLGLFVVFFAGVLANASKLLRRTKSSHQHLALITALIAIGFLINNITAPPDQSPFVIYLFPWLAGVMTTRAEG
jgi:O-antigen ligase